LRQRIARCALSPDIVSATTPDEAAAGSTKLVHDGVHVILDVRKHAFGAASARAEELKDVYWKRGGRGPITRSDYVFRTVATGIALGRMCGHLHAGGAGAAVRVIRTARGGRSRQ